MLKTCMGFLFGTIKRQRNQLVFFPSHFHSIFCFPFLPIKSITSTHNWPKYPKAKDSQFSSLSNKLNPSLVCVVENSRKISIMVKLTIVGRMNDGLPISQVPIYVEDDEENTIYKKHAEFLLHEVSAAALPPCTTTIFLHNNCFK